MEYQQIVFYRTAFEPPRVEIIAINIENKSIISEAPSIMKFPHYAKGDLTLTISDCQQVMHLLLNFGM